MSTTDRLRLGVRVVAGAALLLPLAAACTSGSGSGGGADPAHVTWNQYDQEYAKETRTLTLPSGAHWPSAAPMASKGPGGKAVVFPPGVGRSDADWYWFCSWSRSWLAARTAHPAQARQALTELAKIKTTTYYLVSNEPADRHIYDDELSRAALGDAGPLERDVQLNCPAPA